MIDGSVLQSAQRCFEKKSRVVVKMVVSSTKIQLDLSGTWELTMNPDYSDVAMASQQLA